MFLKHRATDRKRCRSANMFFGCSCSLRGIAGCTPGLFRWRRQRLIRRSRLSSPKHRGTDGKLCRNANMSLGCSCSPHNWRDGLRGRAGCTPGLFRWRRQLLILRSRLSSPKHRNMFFGCSCSSFNWRDGLRGRAGCTPGVFRWRRQRLIRRNRLCSAA
jgi:hypothetical protein